MLPLPRVRRLSLALLLLCSVHVQAQTKVPDLTGFHTPETAVATKIVRGDAPHAGQPGYLGVHAEATKGQLVVTDVEPDTPAERAGLQSGDVLLKVDGKEVHSAADLRTRLQSRPAGSSVALTISRKEQT